MFCILPSLLVLVFAPQISSCFGMGTSCRAERLTEERLGITIQALSQVLTLGKATRTGGTHQELVHSAQFFYFPCCRWEPGTAEHTLEWQRE